MRDVMDPIAVRPVNYKNLRIVNTCGIIRVAAPEVRTSSKTRDSSSCGRYSSLQEFTPTEDEADCQSCIKLADRLTEIKRQLEAEVAEMRRENANAREAFRLAQQIGVDA